MRIVSLEDGGIPRHRQLWHDFLHHESYGAILMSQRLAELEQGFSKLHDDVQQQFHNLQSKNKRNLLIDTEDATIQEGDSARLQEEYKDVRHQLDKFSEQFTQVDTLFCKCDSQLKGLGEFRQSTSIRLLDTEVRLRNCEDRLNVAVNQIQESNILVRAQEEEITLLKVELLELRELHSATGTIDLTTTCPQPQVDAPTTSTKSPNVISQFASGVSSLLSFASPSKADIRAEHKAKGDRMDIDKDASESTKTKASYADAMRSDKSEHKRMSTYRDKRSSIQEPSGKPQTVSEKPKSRSPPPPKAKRVVLVQSLEDDRVYRTKVSAYLTTRLSKGEYCADWNFVFCSDEEEIPSACKNVIVLFVARFSARIEPSSWEHFQTILQERPGGKTIKRGLFLGITPKGNKVDYLELKPGDGIAKVNGKSD